MWLDIVNSCNTGSDLGNQYKFYVFWFGFIRVVILILHQHTAVRADNLVETQRFINSLE